MAQSEGPGAGEAVQVLFVIRIGQPNAFGFGDGER